MTLRMDYAAASPSGIKALGQVYGHVAQSGLDGTLVDLVYLRASQINGCAYCIDMHGRTLAKRGRPLEKLMLVQAWREAAAMFDPEQRAVLGWAEAVTRIGEGVSDEVYAAAVEVLGEKRIIDLTIAIGLMSAFNRLAISFRAAPTGSA